MPKIIFESVLPCSVDALWNFHTDVSALKSLTPPGTQVEIVGPETRVEDGALHQLRIGRFGLSIRWDARISEVRRPNSFVDVAERSPFRFWRHHHEFLANGTESTLRDTVEYEMPFGLLGQLLDRMVVRRQVNRMFHHRHLVTQNLIRLGKN